MKELETEELHDALLDWMNQSDGITIGIPIELAWPILNLLRNLTSFLDTIRGFK